MTSSKDEKKKDKTPSFVELKKGSKFRQLVSRSSVSKPLPARSTLGSVISNAIKMPPTEKRSLTKKTLPLSSVSSDPWDQRTYYYSPNEVVAGTPNSPINAAKKRLRSALETAANTRISTNPIKRVLSDRNLEKSVAQSNVNSEEQGSCCANIKSQGSTSSVPDTVDDKLLGECCRKKDSQSTVEDSSEVKAQDPKTSEQTKICIAVSTTCSPDLSERPSVSSLSKDESCDCDECTEKIKKMSKLMMSATTAKPSTDVTSSSSSCRACSSTSNKPPSSDNQTQAAPTSSLPVKSSCEACIREAHSKRTTSSSKVKSIETAAPSTKAIAEKSTESSKLCYEKCLRDLPTRSSQPSPESTTPERCSINKKNCNAPKSRECAEPGSSAKPTQAESDTPPKCRVDKGKCDLPPRQECVGPGVSETPVSTSESSTKRPGSTTTGGSCLPPPTCGKRASTSEKGEVATAKTARTSTTNLKDSCPPPCSRQVSAVPTSGQPASSTGATATTAGEKTSNQSNLDSLKVPSKPSNLNAPCQQSCSKISSTEQTSSEEVGAKRHSSVACPAFCSRNSAASGATHSQSEHSKADTGSPSGGVCKPCSNLPPGQDTLKKSVSEHTVDKKSGSTSSDTCGLPCPPKTSQQDTLKKSVSKSSETSSEPGLCAIAACQKDQVAPREPSSKSASGTTHSDSTCGLSCTAKSSQQDTLKKSVSRTSATLSQPGMCGTARPSTQTHNPCGLPCSSSQEHKLQKSTGGKRSSTLTRPHRHVEGVCGPCASHPAVQKILRKSSRPGNCGPCAGSGGTAGHSSEPNTMKKSISKSKSEVSDSQANDICGSCSDTNKLKKSISVRSPLSLQPETCKPCISNGAKSSATSPSATSEKNICKDNLATSVGNPNQLGQNDLNRTSSSCKECSGVSATVDSSQSGRSNSNQTSDSCKKCLGAPAVEKSNDSNKTSGRCVECLPTVKQKETVSDNATQSTSKCVECTRERKSVGQPSSKCNLLDIIPEKSSPSESEKETDSAVQRMIDEGSPASGGKADCFYEVNTTTSPQAVEEDVGVCCKKVAQEDVPGGVCPHLMCSIPTTIAPPAKKSEDTPDAEYKEASSDEITTTTCPPGFKSVPDDEAEGEEEDEAEDEAEPTSDFARRKKEPVDHKKLSRLRSRLKKQKRAPKGASRRTLDGSELPVAPHLAPQCSKKAAYRSNRSSCFRQQVHSRLSSCGLRKRRDLSPDSQERRLRGRINYRSGPHLPVRLTHGEHLRRQHLDELRERLLARLNKRKKPFRFH